MNFSVGNFSELFEGELSQGRRLDGSGSAEDSDGRRYKHATVKVRDVPGHAFA